LEYNGKVHNLFVDFKKACDLIRRKVLYNILTEVGIPMKLVMLTKMCFNKTYSKVLTGKYMSHTFLTLNGLKQGDLLSLFFNLVLEYAMRKVQENQE